MTISFRETNRQLSKSRALNTFLTVVTVASLSLFLLSFGLSLYKAGQPEPVCGQQKTEWRE